MKYEIDDYVEIKDDPGKCSFVGIVRKRSEDREHGVYYYVQFWRDSDWVKISEMDISGIADFAP